jgi:hypothetical protein
MSSASNNYPTEMLAMAPASDAEEASPKPPPSKQSNEIPNGGLKAWLQVLGSFLLFLNTWYVCGFPFPFPLSRFLDLATPN